MKDYWCEYQSPWTSAKIAPGSSKDMGLLGKFTRHWAAYRVGVGRLSGKIYKGQGGQGTELRT